MAKSGPLTTLAWSFPVIRFGLLAVTFSLLTAAPSYACEALNGSTASKSQYKVVGDPLFGGTWYSSAGGKTFYERTLTMPANVEGVQIGAMGTDVTAAGSALKITITTPTGEKFVALDLKDVVINRLFSGGAQSTVMDPIMIRFPAVMAASIRIDMKGNGWFGMERTMFFVEGCTTRGLS